MGRRLARSILAAALVARVGAAGSSAAEAAEGLNPGKWVKVTESRGSVGAATVYCPTRKRVLGWGGHKSGNEIRVLDLAKRTWGEDYAPDKASMGGNFYGGQKHCGWINGRPGPFFIFRAMCWDSKRKRMVVGAFNVTAAYEPAARKWTDLKAGYLMPDGQRKAGHPPAGWRKPWFSPMPGQWASMCYDPVNDEVITFPMWVTCSDHSAPRPDDAGVRAGHCGTLTFDCATNTWKRPKLGGKEMLAARARLAELINEQREASRKGWAALIALREQRKDPAVKLMASAAAAQKKVNAKLTEEKIRIEGLAGKLKGYEVKQIGDALLHLSPVIARAERAAVGLGEANPEALPALCSGQRVVYRELRLLREQDLYVQPVPRCGTSVVYDSKNKLVVMAGGNHLDRLLSDTWTYDCVTRRWRRRSAAPEAFNWPGMCFDTKRGVTVYAAGKGTYVYAAAEDKWSKIGEGRPPGIYCDMAYDAALDRYVLNVVGRKHRKGEFTFIMKPGGNGAPVVAVPPLRERPDDASFPPRADPAVLARLKDMPANTWVDAKPNFEPTHRSWSTMSWDPALRCVVYYGGGHAGTMDNQVSAYFPESNKWVKSFDPQLPPPIFGSWCSGAGLTFERGMRIAIHGRWYEFYAGRMVLPHPAYQGFEWATREIPTVGDSHVTASKMKVSGGVRCLHPTKPLTVGLAKGRYLSSYVVAATVYVTDLTTGKETTYKLPKPVPTVDGEWSAICVHPDKNLLVLAGMGKRRKKKADNETWVLDLESPTTWTRLELKSAAPPVGAAAKLSAVAGTDYCILATPRSNELWVLDLERKSWKPLPVTNPKDFLRKGQRFDLYGQCVWDPHHKVIVAMMMGSGRKTKTLLLKPDFSKLKWD